MNSCNICKNRMLIQDNKVICSITNRLADFEGDCLNYKFDLEEFINRKKNLKDAIKRHDEYNLRKPYDNGINGRSFYETGGFYDIPKRNHEVVVIKRNILTRLFPYLLLCSVFIGLNYHLITSFTKLSTLVMVFYIIFDLVLVYIAKILLSEKSYQIILDSEGIQIIGKEIKKHRWKDILAINVVTTKHMTKGGVSNSRNLTIDKLSGELLQYSTQKLLTWKNSLKLLHWAKIYHETYWDKKIKECKDESTKAQQ